MGTQSPDERYEKLLEYCKKLLAEIERLKQELVKYRGY